MNRVIQLAVCGFLVACCRSPTGHAQERQLNAIGADDFSSQEDVAATRATGTFEFTTAGFSVESAADHSANITLDSDQIYHRSLYSLLKALSFTHRYSVQLNGRLTSGRPREFEDEVGIKIVPPKNQLSFLQGKVAFSVYPNFGKREFSKVCRDLNKLIHHPGRLKNFAGDSPLSGNNVRAFLRSIESVSADTKVEDYEDLIEAGVSRDLTKWTNYAGRYRELPDLGIKNAYGEAIATALMCAILADEASQDLAYFKTNGRPKDRKDFITQLNGLIEPLMYPGRSSVD